MLSTPPTNATAVPLRASIPAASNTPDHARAALHDGGERRHVGIELGLETHLPRQVGIGEIGDYRAPHAKIDWTARALRHCLDHRHRQRQGIAVCKWPVYSDKRRAHAGSKPDRLVVIRHYFIPTKNVRGSDI